MTPFSRLPDGYTSIQAPAIPSPTERLSLINAEVSHLSQAFPKREKVGLCLSTANKDILLEYIALCNGLQQEDKTIKFYPCFTDPEVLLFFLNVFSFSRPLQSIPKRFCRIIPNKPQGDLNAHERRSVDLKMLDSLSRVIINNGHPYRDCVNESKILAPDPQEVFIFNLERERTS